MATPGTHDDPSWARPDATLRIVLTRRADGDAVLRCERADGTATWQRHRARLAGHFVPHDLTHYAIETELGLRRAFYGLIAQGWSIEDTTGKGERGALPEEAMVVEQLVGSFDAQRADGEAWTAAELNRQARLYAERAGIAPPRTLTEEELDRVRRRLEDLLDRWERLPPGESIELALPAGSSRASA